MHTLILNADMSPVSLVPLRLMKWQKVIERLFSGALISVHDYEDWVIHSPSCEIRVPAVAMRSRFHRPRNTVRWSKELLLLRDDYTCQYCLRVFPESLLTLDHVVPQKYGGTKCWENIVAACGPCNSAKGHNRKIIPNKMPYRPSYYELLDIRRQYPIQIKHPSWVDYIMWPEDKVIFGKTKI